MINDPLIKVLSYIHTVFDGNYICHERGNFGSEVQPLNKGQCKAFNHLKECPLLV